MKVAINMGVGEAKENAKMLEPPSADRDDRGPEADIRRAEVHRGIQAARGHAVRLIVTLRGGACTSSWTA